MNKELEIQEGKMVKVISLLNNNGWEDLGECQHPIKYPDCHKLQKEQKQIFVSPMKEDYRCIEIWNDKKSLCGVNTLTMKVCDLVPCDIVDTDVDMIDFLKSL